jgi:SAM-dependent methyltransferase
VASAALAGVPTQAHDAGVPAAWLTPREARSEPVHRWFVFPHSYSPALVRHLFEKLDVAEGAAVLDPFCGAGTTLLEASRQGMKPIGVDLLPVAVLASRAKLARPSPASLARASARAVDAAARAAARRPRSDLLERALAAEAHGSLLAALGTAGNDPAGRCVKVATAAAVRPLAKLVADGGWLRSREPAVAASHAGEVLAARLGEMMSDVEAVPGRRAGSVLKADARALPLPGESVQAIVTSPPYPNRHDYTRVFGVELELLFGLGTGVKDLRYRALRSHPEAQAPAVAPLGYRPPTGLSRAIASIASEHSDPRIARMLRGYFEDSFAVLAELRRVLCTGGRAALVVGNASYCGHPIAVDLHLAELAEAAGFRVDGVEALRLRGNSAQQMAVHGRHPSRESAVLLRRP